VNHFDITTNAAEGKANGEGAGAPGRDKAPHGNGYDHEAAGRDRARRFDPNSPEQLAYIAALDRGDYDNIVEPDLQAGPPPRGAKNPDPVAAEIARLSALPRREYEGERSVTFLHSRLGWRMGTIDAEVDRARAKCHPDMPRPDALWHAPGGEPWVTITGRHYPA